MKPLVREVLGMPSEAFMLGSLLFGIVLIATSVVGLYVTRYKPRRKA